MNAQQHAQQWGQLVSQAGRDETFRARLLAEPETVARQFGLQVPAGVELVPADQGFAFLREAAEEAERQREEGHGRVRSLRASPDERFELVSGRNGTDEGYLAPFIISAARRCISWGVSCSTMAQIVHLLPPTSFTVAER